MRAFVMSKKGKIIIAAAVLVVAAAVLVLALSGEKGYRSIRISELSGTVMTEDNNNFYKAYENMYLGDGMVLETDADSYTRMVLDSDKYVKLEQQSRAEFVELGSDTNRNTVIHLEKGVLTNELINPLNGNESYTVTSRNAVMAVRGTYFRVEVKYDANGDSYTDVYTYGGTVACRRIMPDGTIVDEEVLIKEGYKACIKMDEIVTVYVEELIEEEEDNVDPIDIAEISDDDVVDIYNASMNGHKMFADNEKLWDEIGRREIELDDYHSPYDGKRIPHYDDKNKKHDDSDKHPDRNDPPHDDKHEDRPDREHERTDMTTVASESITSAEPEEDTYFQETTVTNYTMTDNEQPAVTSVPYISETERTTAASYTYSSEEYEETSYEDISESTETDISDVTDTEEYLPSETESTSESELTQQMETRTEITTAATSADYTVPDTYVTTVPTNTGMEITTVTTAATETSTDIITVTTVPTETETEITADTTAPTEISTGIITVTTVPTETETEITADTTAPTETSTDIITVTTVPTETETEIIFETTAPTETGSGIITVTTVPTETETEITADTTAPTETSTGIITVTTVPTETETETTTESETTTSVTEETTETTTEAVVVCPGRIAVDSTNFPDAVFRSYVSTNFDTDGNGFLSDEEIAAVTEINVSGTSSVDGGVTSIVGVEHFTALERLFCGYNSGLTEINVTGNTVLTSLYCHDTGISTLATDINVSLTTLSCSNTGITDLDVRFNTVLSELYCMNTNITSLDVSNNTALTWLLCQNTNITVLDVSHNTLLNRLICSYTNITELDLTNNTALTYLECSATKIANIDLSRNIALEVVQCCDTSIPYLDLSYNTAMSNLVCTGNAYPIPSNATTFDATTITGFDPTKVSNITNATFDPATGIFSNITGDVSYTYACNDTYSETFTLTRTGEAIDYGVAVDSTNFPDAVFRSYVSTNFDPDGSGYLSDDVIAAVTSIDVSGTATVDGGVTSLVGVEHFTALERLYCSYNSGLTEINVSNNTALEYLDCSYTGITSLDVSNNTALTDLNCYNTGITSLDLSNNTSLEWLSCYITGITSLDVSNNTALTTLSCYNTGITSLDVSNNTALTRLSCDNTEIASLDVSNNTALETLWCHSCKLPYVDLTNNPNLTSFSATGNAYPIPSNATTFDATTITGFDPTKVSNITNATFDPATGIFSNITGDVSYTYACNDTYSETFTLTRTGEAIEGVAVDSTNFPDAVFRSYVSTNFDTDGNGFLSDTEIAAVTEINVSGTSPSNDGGVTSLKGVEYFTQIKKLWCYYNSGLTELDVSNNTALEYLDCSYTGITSLNVSNNTALTDLWCYDTGITSLDVSNNTALTDLCCYGTGITSLDVSNNTALTDLRCHITGITSLDVSNNTALTKLNCWNTGITSLDVSNNTALTVLYCGNTGITSLDVSNNTALEDLDCGVTGITNLDVSNNTALKYLSCYSTGITSLDVSNNTALTVLTCYSCKLPYVDITNNTSLTTFDASGNAYPIPSNATTFDTSTITGFDPTKVSNITNATFDPATGIFSNIMGDVSYTYACNDTYSETFTLARTGEAIEGVAVDSTNFPDAVFRSYVSTNFDTDGNGFLSDTEIAAVTMIKVGGTSSVDGGIASLKGVEYFTKITRLWCYYNSGLTELDVSNNTVLDSLRCYNTGITSLEVSNNTALTDLRCESTGITSLEVSNNTALTDLWCNSTGITSLDVSNNTTLDTLICNNTGITSLDVSNNTALTYLDCSDTGITSIDVSNNTALTTLRCFYTEITSLDVSSNTSLGVLVCNNTEITSLDVSNNTALAYLVCNDCKISYVDLTNNTNLTTFSAAGNAYPIPSNATTFDATTITGFDPSKVSNVVNADFDSTTGVFSNITGDVTYTYDCGQGYSVTFTLTLTA